MALRRDKHDAQLIWIDTEEGICAYGVRWFPETREFMVYGRPIDSVLVRTRLGDLLRSLGITLADCQAA